MAGPETGFVSHGWLSVHGGRALELASFVQRSSHRQLTAGYWQPPFGFVSHGSTLGTSCLTLETSNLKLLRNWLCFRRGVIRQFSRNPCSRQNLAIIWSRANWLCFARQVPGSRLTDPRNWVCFARMVMTDPVACVFHETREARNSNLETRNVAIAIQLCQYHTIAQIWRQVKSRRSAGF
jgi:hypothetical protein